MSFLEGIQRFKKDSLQPTATCITEPDGRQRVETREDGRVVTRLVDGRSLGFVGDVKPDLQVGEILPGLILGSQDVAADFSILSHYNVTHILNLSVSNDQHFPAQFSYSHIPILDLPDTDIISYFPESFAVIDDGVSHGCVLVHCNAGVSRSASVVIGYLMTRSHMTYQDAYDFVKSKRPSVRPNDGFVKQLRNYNPDLHL